MGRDYREQFAGKFKCFVREQADGDIERWRKYVVFRWHSATRLNDQLIAISVNVVTSIGSKRDFREACSLRCVHRLPCSFDK